MDIKSEDSAEVTSGFEIDNPADITIRPIGIVKNNCLKPPLVAGKDGLKLNGEYEETIEKFHSVREDISEIILKEEYAGLLEDIEDYSHIVILYWGHEITEEGRSLKKVHPMGVETNPLTGLFCTCSPARPNPVLTKVVRLLEVKGNVLKVSGLDAIDKSPVIDIKPYVIEFYPRDDVRIPDWMKVIVENYEE
ncbi:tRNA (N6-threonylcarbamoyladenosine(37)-N6)-methyltransferase TrmO [Methanoplanus limicola]|uniref:Uncharacterized protein family UPF0066 n=1 Tax=Methanoplanus limicola DSM 2279 TaxID=937775 RepID=H1Z059_9EURY|nr:tRNA (N6-threonylcarbamoyladenosine(37)-N6)-methyltransferase TrmO [Methanoplanus limicola]EHQ36151.1 Uncharacterized protein family UPF0066 [Methanoplanus limicola DSM 2279]